MTRSLRVRAGVGAALVVALVAGVSGPAAAAPVVPISAFLQPADMAGAIATVPEAGSAVRYRLCGAPEPAGVVASAQRQWLARFDSVESVPQQYREAIRLYLDEASATQAMAALRSAASACRTTTENGETVTYRVRALSGGDEAFTVVKSVPARQGDGTLIPGQTTTYLQSFIRSGQAIAIVSDAGWENMGAIEEWFATVVARAANRLVAWQNG